MKAQRYPLQRPLLLWFVACVLIHTGLVISSGRYYIDDLGRSIYGYLGWSANGRPLADAVMYLLSFGLPAVDISPLPQLLAALAMLPCLLLVRRFLPAEKTGWVLLAALSIQLSPFYLENISYKYDSLMMALALGCVLLPFARPSSSAKAWLGGAALVFLSLNFYQAALSVFVIIACLELLMTLTHGRSPRESLVQLIGRVLQLGLGLTAYKLLVAPFFVTGDYNLAHSATVSLNTEGWQTIKHNWRLFSHLLGKFLTPVARWLFLPFVVFAFGFAWWTGIRTLRGGHTLWIAALTMLACLAIPLVVTIAIYGPLLLLKEPVLAPRVLLGFGALLMFVFVSFVGATTGPLERLRPLALLPVFYLVVLSLAYVNASREQADFDMVLGSQIAAALQSPELKGVKHVGVIGQQPASPVLRLAMQKFPLLQDLVPLYLRWNWVWGGTMLNHYGVELSQIDVVESDLKRGECLPNPPVAQGPDFSVSRFEDIALVQFGHNSHCPNGGY